MFFVDVGFGESKSTRKQTQTRFEFDTAAELTAFIDGLDAAIGWFEYEITDDGVIRKSDT
jgi:hypothetical protein